jgi:hypothetical protein
MLSIVPAVKEQHNAGGALRANRILACLEAGYPSSGRGDELLHPGTVVYNQVINYWAKTQSVGGHYLRAWDILNRHISFALIIWNTFLCRGFVNTSVHIS